MATSPPPAGPRPPSRALLLVAAALFVAGFLVTVIAVVHRPDYVVLTGMDEAELRWFRPRLERFAENHHVRLAVLPWKDGADLERLLAEDRRRSHPRVLLAEVPQERMVPLVDSAAVQPLAQVKGLAHLDETLARFHAAALDPCRVAGRAYFLPSRVSTLCLYYSKSRVADAYAHWTEVRPQIERWLKEANGYGLPADFHFDEEPKHWDTYDVFVVAAYWAAKSEGGMKVARVAHVVAPREALAADVASRAFAMGAQGDDVLLVGGDRLGDALAWESLLFRYGLYHPAMLRERWTAKDILAAIAQGQVWMATLDPRDVFRLHGLPGQDGYVRDLADLGVAPMPRGESLLLDRHNPARAGDPWAARAVFGWGVPARCPDPPLAADLLAEVTSPETQADAATALGWIPPAASVMGELDVLYRDPELFEIARVGARQAYVDGRTLPSSPRWLAAREALDSVWEEASVKDRLTSPRDLAEALRLAAPRR